jgi:hypothetical protein
MSDQAYMPDVNHSVSSQSPRRIQNSVEELNKISDTRTYLEAAFAMSNGLKEASRGYKSLNNS